MRFQGIYTPIITPFFEDGSIDWDSYARVIEFQIESGVAGIIVGGSTGEFYALSKQERIDQFKFAVEKNQGSVIISGKDDDRHFLQGPFESFPGFAQGTFSDFAFFNLTGKQPFTFFKTFSQFRNFRVHIAHLVFECIKFRFASLRVNQLNRFLKEIPSSSKFYRQRANFF